MPRTRSRRLGDRFPDDREAFGEEDGAVVEVVLVVVILGSLRLLILGRDIMGSRKVGDRDSGLERWEELLLGTWLGTEETDRSP